MVGSVGFMVILWYLLGGVWRFWRGDAFNASVRGGMLLEWGNALGLWGCFLMRVGSFFGGGACIFVVFALCGYG